MGVYYGLGKYGLPQDYAKALDLYHWAGILGHTTAYYYIGCVYDIGRGVENIMKL